MFELPELLGSPYVLPAIIVVVVLLLLLLLIGMSRRRRARSAGKAGRPVGRAATRTSAAAPYAATARDDLAGRGTSDSLGKAAASATRSKGTALPSDADPVHAVIADLLQGWGDITVEDTNRLKIFRADKVAAALATAEVPKNLKNSEQARARLNQLRHYASALQTAPTAGPAAPADVAEEAAGEERAAEASWGIKKDDVLADAAADAPRSRVSWYGFEVTETAPTAESPPEQPETLAEEQPQTLAEDQPETAEPVTEEKAEEIGTFPEEQAELVEEIPAEIVEVELPIEERPSAVSEAPEPGEAADADSFFSDLGIVVTTAEELLRLPSDEQAAMLAFLSPAELGRVFQTTGDPELKKAVIDTLEHVGNTTALDVIHDCLDDPDPDIQVYALDAADRLLGVDQ